MTEGAVAAAESALKSLQNTATAEEEEGTARAGTTDEGGKARESFSLGSRERGGTTQAEGDSLI